MADNLSESQRSFCMSRIRSSNTSPEVSVRRLAHRLGFRFKLHDARLPGRPDLVFPALQKVIFVHGCFWHRHRCRRGRLLPSSNCVYWLQKLANNRKRDSANRCRLKVKGWSVLVIWECQLGDLDDVSSTILGFLKGR